MRASRRWNLVAAATLIVALSVWLCWQESHAAPEAGGTEEVALHEPVALSVPARAEVETKAQAASSNEVQPKLHSSPSTAKVTIRGWLIEKETGAGIADAEVVAGTTVGSDHARFKANATTDADGMMRLAVPSEAVAGGSFALVQAKDTKGVLVFYGASVMRDGFRLMANSSVSLSGTVATESLPPGQWSVRLEREPDANYVAVRLFVALAQVDANGRFHAEARPPQGMTKAGVDLALSGFQVFMRRAS